jgi:hypothetical protein
MTNMIEGYVYDPKGLVKPDEDWDRRGAKDYIRYSEDDEFHIGQGYEGVPAKRMECIHCDGTQFIVGQGNYYTAVKCPTCSWEVMIHEG